MDTYKQNNNEISEQDSEYLKDELHDISCSINESVNDSNRSRDEINKLQAEIESLAAEIGTAVPHSEPMEPILLKLNTEVDESISLPERKVKAFPKLSTPEILVSSISGLVSVLIDVVLVGTPEIVRLYHGGENFDGSVLTKLLREIGNDDKLSQILKWLSDKCIVPYDIPLKPGVVTPNNHRLRGLAHDPFLGLFFAVADIIMGTTTCIDNNGRLTVLINKNPADESTKLLSVFYYIGHILSDICTSRGIPVPGFFLTQFFTADKPDHSLAKIAENMYIDGYDLRHLGSMSVPVITKNLIIDSYLALSGSTSAFPMPIAESEHAKINERLKKEKMLFIANAIGTAGNAVKIIAPPNCGNPAAINLPQWYAMVSNSINMLRANLRDKTAEQIMDKRTDINRKWDALLNE